MIFCYTATQKSKFYADVLGDVLGRPVHMLDCELGSDFGPDLRFGFMLRAIWYTIAKKPAAVVNMPALEDIGDGDVYLCGPVWGGHPAPPLRYFLGSLAALRARKVHMLLTATVGHERQIKNAKKMIEGAGLVAGNVEIFATGGGLVPERDVVEEHIRSLMLDGAEAR